MSQRQRTVLDATELAVVLSHFDLGVIESVTEFARGSRRSPKVGVVCERGKFLLKQRSLSRARPERVQFSHRVQHVLLNAGFPLPRLLPTRDTRQTYLIHRDHVYEMFEFVPGHNFERIPPEARDAGRTLAQFHQIVEPFPLAGTPGVAGGDFHDAAGVRVGLCRISSTLSSHDSFTGDEAELANLVQTLLEAYDRSAETVNGLGFQEQPLRIVHSDWHPGNLLFRDGGVVAVVDYDSLRASRRLTDLANGALHFSILAGEDPTTWPDHLDESLLAAFLAGFEERTALSSSDRQSIPHLMIEALIAECVPPITETGSVGRWSGFRILQMVRRKVLWLGLHGDRLIQP